MAQNAGQLNTYSATLPQKRVVTDRIIMADVNAIAGINAIGLDNADKFQFVNTPGRTYEWLQDTYASRTDTANGGLSASSTTTTFTATDPNVYVVGDVILIDSEYIWVSSISGTTITVVRNFGGTQATHANTSSVSIVGSARLEGASADTFIWTAPTTGYNYSQIFQRTIEISRTDARIKQYGIPNVVDREINKKMDELTMLLDFAMYHGQRNAGSATTARSFGGLQTFITTNVTDCSSAALTQKNIEDNLSLAFTAGGNPTLLICNTWAKRKIADFYSGYVRTERSETMGGITIDKILMPVGIEVDVMVDRWCPTDRLFIIDPRFVGYITLDEFFEEPLGKTKDTAYYGQVVGEYGFACAFEKANAIVKNYSTTA